MPSSHTLPSKLPCQDIEDLSHWSQQDLVEEAEAWSDQFQEGEEGYCPPEHATWVIENHYPIEKIAPTNEARQEWIGFIDAEIKMWAEDGDPQRFNDMKDGKIREHIVVLVRDGEHYIWDGNHRLAAAIKAGVKTIPVLLGTPMSELEIQQKFGGQPDRAVSSEMSL